MSVADLKKALGEVGFTQLKKAVNTWECNCIYGKDFK
jgi:hypothetical protein